MKQLLTAIIVAITGLGVCVTEGAVDFGGAYSQSFDTLATSGTANTWENDSTITGWFLFTSGGAAVTSYRAGTGSNNTGDFYSFGASGENERALGGVGSGSFAGYISVSLRNATGSTLDGFVLNWNGEQWRNGGNTSPQTMEMEYGFGDTFASVTTWVATGSTFDFVSPVATSTAAAVDGNTAGRVTGLGGTISGISWQNDQSLWLRWIEVDDAGADHGLAIDDFSITAVPEPAEWGLICAVGLLGVCGLHTWRERRRAVRQSSSVS